MLKTITDTLRWTLSLGIKLMKVAAGPTALGISFAFASQVAMVLSFFLPLKVIILLGSPSIPSFFPESWQELDRDFLIIGFTVGAIGSYLLHLFSDVVVQKSSVNGSEKLLEKSNKFSLLPDQNKIAADAHERYSRVIAALIYTVAVLAVLIVIYPELLLLLLSYAVMAISIIVVGGNLSNAFQGRLTHKIGKTTHIITSLAFLSVFLFMVVDFLLEPAPSVVVASISIILVRQSLGQLSRMINDISSLSKRRRQIDGMFFHGRVRDSSKTEEGQGFWSLFGRKALLGWVTSSLGEEIVVKDKSIEIAFRSIPIRSVVGVEASVLDDSRLQLGRYLVKIFDTIREPMAFQEGALFGGLRSHSLPSLDFVKPLVFTNYQCILYELPQGKKLSGTDERAARFTVLKELFLYSPPESLISKYSRSSLMLPQRLDMQLFERLCLFVSNQAEQSWVEECKNRLGSFHDRLNSLPKQVVNPDSRANNMFASDDGRVLLVNWHRWGIEPLGAGWPTNDGAIKRLKEVCKVARRDGAITSDVIEEDVVLAALLHQLESYYEAHNFVSAISMLPKILECTPRGDEEASV